MNPVLGGGLALWLLIGCGVAVALHRAGHDPATTMLALGCWPLFVHTLHESPAGSTPYAARITGSLHRLSQAATAAGEDPGDLDTLRQSLRDADERLGRIDALLREDPQEPALHTRRAEAAHGIELALGDLAAIRLQFALMSVDGADPSAKPAEALSALRARLQVARELRG